MNIDQIIKKNKRGILLDIGCGENKQGENFIGIDIRELPGVDIVHDIEVFPWPLPDECVLTAIASHVVEHINPHKFGFVNFMNEVWRVMKPGGQFAISCPHGASQGFRQDPTHINAMDEATFNYFDPLVENSFWYIYKPKPWKIAQRHWNPAANIEVLLIKRLEQKENE